MIQFLSQDATQHVYRDRNCIGRRRGTQRFIGKGLVALAGLRPSSLESIEDIIVHPHRDAGLADIRLGRADRRARKVHPGHFARTGVAGNRSVNRSVNRSAFLGRGNLRSRFKFRHIGSPLFRSPFVG